MTRRKPHRVADDLTAGMQAIGRMIARGKQPNELYTARTIEAQRAEPERRRAASIAHPEAVTPWEQVKARALARTKR